jgi:AI-2 transport protein TqsA
VTADSPSGRQATWILAGAGVVVIIAGLRAAAPLILPFLVAVFLAAISFPLLQRLEQLRVPRVVAVLAAVIANLLVLAVAVAVMGTALTQFTAASPRYQVRLQALAATALEWLRDQGFEIHPSEYLRLVNPGAILDLVGAGLAAATAVLSNLLVVLLTLAFILLEASGLPRKLQAAFASDPSTLEWLGGIIREVQRYLLLKTAVSLATGALIWAWLALLGIDFALVWGLVAFALNYIPNIGSILAAVPAVLLSMVQFDVGRAFLVTLGYLVVNLVLGNIVEPYLMGRRLGLSTLVVFLSLIFWGWVWGPVGMLLSVPLTMIAKIMLERTESLGWLAVLLDSGPPARGTETPAR